MAAVLERLVDTIAPCAVHLDETGRLTARHTRQLTDLAAELERGGQRLGLAVPRMPVAA